MRKKLQIDQGLQLEDNNIDIKQFYNLGMELGQGTYGVVKISQRNCQATNMHIMNQIMCSPTVIEPTDR